MLFLWLGCISILSRSRLPFKQHSSCIQIFAARGPDSRRQSPWKKDFLLNDKSTPDLPRFTYLRTRFWIYFLFILYSQRIRNCTLQNLQWRRLHWRPLLKKSFHCCTTCRIVPSGMKWSTSKYGNDWNCWKMITHHRRYFLTHIRTFYRLLLKNIYNSNRVGTRRYTIKYSLM